MPDRVTFSGKVVDLQSYADHQRDIDRALRLYFGAAASLAGARFFGYTRDELLAELNLRLIEVDISASLIVLSAVEAALRVDYLQRCQQKKRDKVSRAFRELFKDKKAAARLEDDIITIWQTNFPERKILLGELKGAFRFRHWIAHGRYWEPKFGRKYDFVTVYGLAIGVLGRLPLFGA